jgi:hypothetical protein
MGTRAQVFMKDTGVYLYQHWDGDLLVDTVVKAVNGIGVDRQDDPEYLTRIIFSQMIKEDIDGATGYGIGCEEHGDIEYLVVVDCEKRLITEIKVYTSNVMREIPFSKNILK